MIRLQCYEGLDESKALYEWKYGKQLLYTQLLRDKLDSLVDREDTFPSRSTNSTRTTTSSFPGTFSNPGRFSRRSQQKDGTVLLIDEVDKADDEFEASCSRSCLIFRSPSRRSVRSTR